MKALSLESVTWRSLAENMSKSVDLVVWEHVECCVNESAAYSVTNSVGNFVWDIIRDFVSGSIHRHIKQKIK